MEAMPGIFAMLVPIVGAIALFTFLAIASWSEERRKEREAYYRYEFRKKLVEHGGASSEQLLELMNHEETAILRRRRESLKLGGFITAAVGLGLLIFLKMIEPYQNVWAVGLIPLLIGVVLVVYAFVMPVEPPPQIGPGGGRPPLP